MKLVFIKVAWVRFRSFLTQRANVSNYGDIVANSTVIFKFFFTFCVPPILLYTSDFIILDNIWSDFLLFRILKVDKYQNAADFSQIKLLVLISNCCWLHCYFLRILKSSLNTEQTSFSFSKLWFSTVSKVVRFSCNHEDSLV